MVTRYHGVVMSPGVHRVTPLPSNIGSNPVASSCWWSKYSPSQEAASVSVPVCHISACAPPGLTLNKSTLFHKPNEKHILPRGGIEPSSLPQSGLQGYQLNYQYRYVYFNWVVGIVLNRIKSFCMSIKITTPDFLSFFCFCNG